MSPRSPAEETAPALLWAPGLLVAAASLFFWSATDRLDLPKQLVLVLGTLLSLAWCQKKRALPPIDPLTVALFGLFLLAAALSFEEVGARVEGAGGFLAALALLALARHGDEKILARCLGGLCLVLASLAWLQALSIPIANGGLTGFEGRRVVGTLGGPGHLGWTLAALLPWLGGLPLLSPQKEGKRTALFSVALLAWVLGAIILSGSRVAWGITLVSLPFWVRRPLWPRLLCALLLGALAASSLEALFGLSRLGQRVADLGDSGGTAWGRLYLWRALLSGLQTSPVWLGLGPEGFLRWWPEAQERFLAQNPQEEHFRSDLRHAHADPVELLVDFGVLGLALVLLVLWRALFGRRRSQKEEQRRPFALASLVALLVGGLGAPVLYFAPTLALFAISLGLRLGPPRYKLHPRAWGVVAVALGLLTTLLFFRLFSEMTRAEATLARLAQNPPLARRYAEEAARRDPRNPRAWLELALACDALGDLPCAREALQKTARDLPTHGVKEGMRLLTK